MVSRRNFLRISTSTALAYGLIGCGGGGGGGDSTALSATPMPTGATPMPGKNWRMPDEAAQHRATWMAFVADSAIWGR